MTSYVQAVSGHRIASFWKLVDRSGGPDACWPWTGAVTEKGYGRFYAGHKALKAHRFACLLAHGAPGDQRLQACHSLKCTTKRCCNGSHLRWDTNKGNHADVVALGTQAGERQWKTKLTEEMVRDIRTQKDAGARTRDLVRRFGVGRDVINRIWRRKAWKHVTDEPVARPAPSSTPDHAMLLEPPPGAPRFPGAMGDGVIGEHVCEPNRWSNEAGTLICNTCGGRPSHDWYQRRQEAARPAPSSTMCKDCKGKWVPGHLCSAGETKK